MLELFLLEPEVDFSVFVLDQFLGQLDAVDGSSNRQLMREKHLRIFDLLQVVLSGVDQGMSLSWTWRLVF